MEEVWEMAQRQREVVTRFYDSNKEVVDFKNVEWLEREDPEVNEKRAMDVWVPLTELSRSSI